MQETLPGNKWLVCVYVCVCVCLCVCVCVRVCGCAFRRSNSVTKATFNNRVESEEHKQLVEEFTFSDSSIHANE